MNISFPSWNENTSTLPSRCNSLLSSTPRHLSLTSTFSPPFSSSLLFSPLLYISFFTSPYPLLFISLASSHHPFTSHSSPPSFSSLFFPLPSPAVPLPSLPFSPSFPYLFPSFPFLPSLLLQLNLHLHFLWVWW